MRFQLDHVQLYIRANREEQRATGYASRSVVTFHRQRMVEKRLTRAHEQTLIAQHTRLINMTAFVSCSFAGPRSFVLYRKQRPTKTTTIRR